MIKKCFNEKKKKKKKKEKKLTKQVREVISK